ncbi:hypothetical protein MesoLj131a_02990 [Mesorhizobium sp. 131-2-1]|nr:hypothetical protein MesoLj131a_02990 [Mesorhizobium sp. 131-2-1]
MLIGNSPQLKGVDFLLTGEVSGAHAMKISREQCELVRAQLIRDATNLKNYQEAMKRAQLAMLDLAALNYQLQHLGGEHDVSPITDRVQKAIDEVSGATKSALATTDHSPGGATAFMDVCGPPPN